MKLKYENQVHNFKTESVRNQIAIGTTFTTDHTTWVQIYRFHPFIIGHNQLIIDLSYIVSTEHVLRNTRNPQENKCHSGPAGSEACISINFSRTRAAKLCGRALITQSGSYNHCPNKSAGSIQNIVTPNCPELHGRTFVVTGEELDLAVSCNGQAPEHVVIKPGTTPLGEGCNVENTKTRMQDEWSFNAPQELEHLTQQHYPLDNSILWGLNLRDIIIIILVTLSTLLSLGTGVLCYFKFRRRSQNHLEAYKQALRSNLHLIS